MHPTGTNSPEAWPLVFPEHRHRAPRMKPAGERERDWHFKCFRRARCTASRERSPPFSAARPSIHFRPNRDREGREGSLVCEGSVLSSAGRPPSSGPHANVLSAPLADLVPSVGGSPPRLLHPDASRGRCQSFIGSFNSTR